MKFMKFRFTSLSFILIAILMLTSACSNRSMSMNGHDESNSDDGVPEVTAVQIHTLPEKINLGQPILILAMVTQGSQVVADAKKVEFELWKRGQKEHELIIAKSKGAGIYHIEKSFSESGIYYVIAHVTARDMHNMPLKEMIVGNVTADELAEARSGEKETSNLEDHEM